jgi:DNA-binding NtrC family response regulator/predicted hydrocarbon binding protein
MATELPPTPPIQDLAQLVHFESEEGRIWLNEERMVLVHASAMRALRSELIDTLGVERAKGFLVRMGYIAGKQDAETARKLRPDMSDYDVFLVGPQSHMLTGMVKVKPINLEMDVDNGHFLGEFEWTNSFEAEVFMAEFGMSTEPVCWEQIGYASGFASQFMRKRILFKEMRCAACGENSCRIVGKPAEEWEDCDEQLQYYQPDNIADTILELQSQVSSLRKSIEQTKSFEDIIGQSESFKQACELISKAADSKVTVLLLGETGVGKDMFAHAIHKQSSRANGPFVAVNCAAIPKDLIEAELFGVEKGAYTGADQSRPGRFERAHGGTLFLDEVGELSPQAQAALLRVLQNGEFERVGDVRSRSADVRLVTATNENLDQAVAEGRFRSDLLYRLNVYSVMIPPLRERRDDISLLVEHFIEKYSALHGTRCKGITDKALSQLKHYNWPGNIRELGNVIERGIILANNDYIEASMLFSQPPVEEPMMTVNEDGALCEQKAMSAQGASLVEQILDADLGGLDGLEKVLIDAALARTDGNVTQAAKLLGLTRPALDYRLKKAAK